MRRRAVEHPTVSVVIPAHGRIAKLQRCLEALAAQTLPRDEFEVIVCDDGSPEPIAPALEGFNDRLTLTVVRQERRGPAAARNEGARHASGSLLVFTDDDCVPEEDWLEHLVANIERYPGHLIGGSIVNLLTDDPYATATQLITSCVYDYYARHPESRRLYCTANLAVPRNRFWLLGGFSEQYQRAAGEDYDFCARWTEAGFPNHYAPEATVGHSHGHSLVQLLAPALRLRTRPVARATGDGAASRSRRDRARVAELLPRHPRLPIRARSGHAAFPRQGDDAGAAVAAGDGRRRRARVARARRGLARPRENWTRLDRPKAPSAVP